MGLSCTLTASPPPRWQVGTVVTLTATVYMDGTPVAGAAVTFQMQYGAIRIPSGQIMTDGSGKAYYSFTIPKEAEAAGSVDFGAIVQYPWPYPKYYTSCGTSGQVGPPSLSVSLSASPSPPWQLYQPVTLTATVKYSTTGAPASGRTIVFYVSESGSPYAKVGSCTTGSDGKCSITWSPKTGGTIKIICWDSQTGDKSNEITGSAPTAPPPAPCTRRVSISVDKTQVTPGASITISGSVLCDSRAEPNYPVTLISDWFKAFTIYTDYMGKYSYTTNAPLKDGTYTITASIPGDQKSVTITVKTPAVERPTRIRVLTTSAYKGIEFAVEGYLEYQDVDGSWKPLGGQTVELLDLNRYKTYGTGVTDASGKFKIPGLLTWSDSISYWIQFRGVVNQYQGCGMVITITLKTPTIYFDVYANPPPDWYLDDWVKIYGYLKTAEFGPMAGVNITCEVYINGVYAFNLAGVSTGSDGSFIFPSEGMYNKKVGDVITFKVKEGKWNTTKEISGKIVGEKRAGVAKPYNVTLQVSPGPPWYVGQTITLTAKVMQDSSPVANQSVSFVVYPEGTTPGKIIGEAITDSQGVASIKHTIVVGGKIEIKASAYNPYTKTMYYSPSIWGEVISAPPPTPTPTPPPTVTKKLRLSYKIVEGTLPVKLEIPSITIPGVTIPEYVKSYTITTKEGTLDLLTITLTSGTYNITVAWKMTDSTGLSISGEAKKSITI